MPPTFDIIFHFKIKETRTVDSFCHKMKRLSQFWNMMYLHRKMLCFPCVIITDTLVACVWLDRGCFVLLLFCYSMILLIMLGGWTRMIGWACTLWNIIFVRYNVFDLLYCIFMGYVTSNMNLSIIQSYVFLTSGRVQTLISMYIVHQLYKY